MFHFKQQLLIQKFHKQQESSDSQNSHEQVVLSQNPQSIALS